MSEKKQIVEEMARHIPARIFVYDVSENTENLDEQHREIVALHLYRAGYRKQSEWISVEERLPQVTGKYICCVKDKRGNTWTVPADWNLEMKMWFGEFGEIKNMVTHWMPLPEPPKESKR